MIEHASSVTSSADTAEHLQQTLKERERTISRLRARCNKLTAHSVASLIVAIDAEIDEVITEYGGGESYKQVPYIAGRVAALYWVEEILKSIK